MSILEARAAEMAAHPHGWMSRASDLTVSTIADLAGRLSNATAAVVSLDGQPAPSPDLLPGLAALFTSRPGPCVELSARPLWTSIDALGARVVLLEGRLGQIDHVAPPDASTDPLARIAAEVALQGFGSRHPERLFDAIRQLITRTLAIEARISALASPKPTA